MALLSDFKYRQQAKADFKRCVEAKKHDISRFEQYAVKEWQRYEKLKDAVENGVFDEQYFASWNQQYVEEVKKTQPS
jgi:hypothetical protein